MLHTRSLQLERLTPCFLKKLPPVRKASEIVVNDSLKPTGLESLSMPSRPKVEEKVGSKVYDLTRY